MTLSVPTVHRDLKAAGSEFQRHMKRPLRSFVEIVGLVFGNVVVVVVVVGVVVVVVVEVVVVEPTDVVVVVGVVVVVVGVVVVGVGVVVVRTVGLNETGRYRRVARN
jgi:hypothetical protein